MSSFFTLPASQKKRKRTQSQNKSNASSRPSRISRDDSISGSDLPSDDDAGSAPSAAGSGSEDEEEDDPDEDPASKRIRLAEQYLANTQKEVLLDEGFDAKDVDQENLRQRMGERLKEDTAETKGKIFRWFADELDWRGAERRVVRHGRLGKSVTGVAVQGQFLYAVSKDLTVVKWELADGREAPKGTRARRKPKVVACTQGNRKDVHAQHHHNAILCVAVSGDGKFVVTGGMDNKIVVWDSALKPLKVFSHHRDSVTALAFRRGTNQLFSASKDRTVKIWSLDELAYVETLFGHQDEVVDVGALTQEKCVTVGARDRTARLWKVVEESQLVFRGGGAPPRAKALEALRQAYLGGQGEFSEQENLYHEGSIDRITMVDDDTFITASDSGSMSLWNVNKKKAVYTLPLAHGLDPPLPLQQASAEIELDETLDESGRGGKQPRWVTALRAIPFSNVIVTGSWDGYVRAWRISQDKRRIEPLGAVGVVPQGLDRVLDEGGLIPEALEASTAEAMNGASEDEGMVKGVVNDLAIVDQGEKGKRGVLVAAAVGRQCRLGRWKEVPGAKDCVVLFQVPRKVLEEADEDQSAAGAEGEDEGFQGFGQD